MGRRRRRSRPSPLASRPPPALSSDLEPLHELDVVQRARLDQLGDVDRLKRGGGGKDGARLSARTRPRPAPPPRSPHLVHTRPRQRGLQRFVVVDRVVLRPRVEVDLRRRRGGRETRGWASPRARKRPPSPPLPSFPHLGQGDGAGVQRVHELAGDGAGRGLTGGRRGGKETVDAPRAASAPARGSPAGRGTARARRALSATPAPPPSLILPARFW